jgi:hypothetical protein
MLPLWHQLAFLTTASQPDKTTKGTTKHRLASINVL